MGHVPLRPLVAVRVLSGRRESGWVGEEAIRGSGRGRPWAEHLHTVDPDRRPGSGGKDRGSAGTQSFPLPSRVPGSWFTRGRGQRLVRVGLSRSGPLLREAHCLKGETLSFISSHLTVEGRKHGHGLPH